MSSMKNKMKRAASKTAAATKRAASKTAAATKRAALAARAKYDQMRQGKKAPANAPTPYVNQNGNRIYKSNNGAVFTKNNEGDRNYSPIATAIKKPNENAMRLNMNNKNTVPNNIRPSNNNNNIQNK